MAAVDVYRATPSSTGAREVPENDTEELQLSQEDMDVASLAANAVTPPVIASSVASTINSAPAYVSTTAGGERNQPHQVQVVDGSSGGGTGGTESGVLITEPVLGVRMLMSSRVSGERVRERLPSPQSDFGGVWVVSSTCTCVGDRIYHYYYNWGDCIIQCHLHGFPIDQDVDIEYLVFLYTVGECNIILCT